MVESGVPFFKAFNIYCQRKGRPLWGVVSPACVLLAWFQALLLFTAPSFPHVAPMGKQPPRFRQPARTLPKCRGLFEGDRGPCKSSVWSQRRKSYRQWWLSPGCTRGPSDSNFLNFAKAARAIVLKKEEIRQMEFCHIYLSPEIPLVVSWT